MDQYRWRVRCAGSVGIELTTSRVQRPRDWARRESGRPLSTPRCSSQHDLVPVGSGGIAQCRRQTQNKRAAPRRRQVAAVRQLNGENSSHWHLQRACTATLLNGVRGFDHAITHNHACSYSPCMNATGSRIKSFASSPRATGQHPFEWSAQRDSPMKALRSRVVRQDLRDRRSSV